MSIGIYKITNNTNNNAYIGLSIDIERRWKEHRSNYHYKDQYEKVLYRAFRKYGIENFSFSIIEECEPFQLREREKYWIAYYDTYHNGYNETEGGDGVSMPGEKHPNHKITLQDVIYIRQLWASCSISTREMYYEFSNRIGKTGFQKIYTWQTWKKVLPELNTEENRNWHKNNKISFISNGGANITEEEFEDIKNRYNKGEPLKSIFEDYKSKYVSYHSFYNANRKRLENNTCIDYPRC